MKPMSMMPTLCISHKLGGEGQFSSKEQTKHLRSKEQA
jgi:hypothetical protein